MSRKSSEKQPQTISLEEAIERLATTRRMVLRLIHIGKVQSEKDEIGNILVRKADVDALAETTEKTRSESAPLTEMAQCPRCRNFVRSELMAKTVRRGYKTALCGVCDDHLSKERPIKPLKESLRLPTGVRYPRWFDDLCDECREKARKGFHADARARRSYTRPE